MDGFVKWSFEIIIRLRKIRLEFTIFIIQRFLFVPSKSIVWSMNFSAAFSDKTALGTFL